MQIVVPNEYKPLYIYDEENPIVKVPAAVLLKKAIEVQRVTKWHMVIAENMSRILIKARGIGLAAPQIGISERIIVISPNDRPIVMYNPRVMRAEGSQIGEEGCLSIPGLYGNVERSEFVEATALDRKGRESTWDLDGLAARVFLHELDHLEGILFTERADPATLYWQMPSADRRAE